MISESALRPFSVLIGIVSAAAAAAAYFALPFQWTVWEIQIDGRLVVLAGALYWYFRRGLFTPDLASIGVNGWRFKEAVFWFLIPVAVLLVSALLGMAAGGVTFKALDNPETLLLGSLFDIPAVYVFSACTLLIEEAIFRSLLHRSVRRHRTTVRALAWTSALWLLYSLPDIAGIEGITLLAASFSAIFFFLSSIVWTLLTNSYRSIWFSYSFRIGIAVFNPILLSSMLFENDAFFEAKDAIFQSEGIIVSLILLFISIILWKKKGISEVP